MSTCFYAFFSQNINKICIVNVSLRIALCYVDFVISDSSDWDGGLYRVPRHAGNRPISGQVDTMRYLINNVFMANLYTTINICDQTREPAHQTQIDT